MEEIYIVKICTGSFGDFFEKVHFATLSKKKADTWTRRFNELVKRRREEIKPLVKKDDNYHPYFWIEILYDSPTAKVDAIKLR